MAERMDSNIIMRACPTPTHLLKVFVFKLCRAQYDIESQLIETRLPVSIGFNGPAKQVIRVKMWPSISARIDENPMSGPVQFSHLVLSNSFTTCMD